MPEGPMVHSAYRARQTTLGPGNSVVAGRVRSYHVDPVFATLRRSIDYEGFNLRTATQLEHQARAHHVFPSSK